MFKLDNDFLQSLGLGGLPVDEKNRLLQMIYERLEMNVGMRLAEKMTDQQLDEFEGFIDRNDEAGALKWLETNFPNYKDVVAEELEKLRLEVTNAAPQILAAQSGAPGAQMPPIMNEPQMPGVPQPQQAMPQYGPQPQPAYNPPMPQPPVQPAYGSQPFGPPQQPGFAPPAPQQAFDPNPPAPVQPPQQPQPSFSPPQPQQMPAFQPPAPTQQPSFAQQPPQPQQPQPFDPSQSQQFTPPPVGFTPGQ